MIESDVYVMEGSILPFQESGIPFETFPVAYDLLNWGEDERMLVITTGTVWGAVHFRAEELASEPPLDLISWEEMQEVSVNFRSDNVKLLDLEETQKETFPDVSLISKPGLYRVRVYAVGRHSGIDMQQVGEHLDERYLMQLWGESKARPSTPVQTIGDRN